MFVVYPGVGYHSSLNLLVFVFLWKLLEYLIEEYFDQNPISQLGIIVTRNKRSEKVTELGGNPRMHISHLQKLRESKCEGEPSLQNALSLAADTLKWVLSPLF